VGFATHSGQIHILSPDIMPVAFEKTGQLRFIKTLKHEIGHIYTSQINKRAPSWLNEGISLHLAEQDYYQKVGPSMITTALLEELDDDQSDGRIYQVGIHMVDEIIAIGGKELLIKITSIQDKDERNELLRATFSWLK